MNPTTINHNDLYRFPWTLADNSISWLEPTSECNLKCDGCYRDNIKGGHKPLDEVKADLDVFQSQRKSDCISIAGGDPLLYPDIIELVTEIKRPGLEAHPQHQRQGLDPRTSDRLEESGPLRFHLPRGQRPGTTGQVGRHE